MAEKSNPVLLVDYENIQDLSLLKRLLATAFEVRVFVGANQTKIPVDVVKTAQRFGERLGWVQIDGHGKNALDFHIAYTLGLLVAESKSRGLYVLSRDTGFDPLLQYLVKRGIPCRRVSSVDDWSSIARPASPSPQPTIPRATDELSESPPPPTSRQGVSMTDVQLFINGIPPRNRPKTPKTLAAHLASHFKKQASGADFSAIVTELAHRSVIVINGNSLSYRSK
ncbi:PIN domain-containing protein [Niveibacterium sp.]|uniref:PIN domain-containing protein n=1 Tax=Niveibacterium sp. TaxID=2017444 RepID=UPI0035B3502E